MSKYTAEQVEAEIASYAEEAFPREEIDLEHVTAMLHDYAALLREREAAKVAGTEDIARKLGDEYFRLCKLANRDPLQAGFWIAQLRAALEAVAPMLASARVPDVLPTDVRIESWPMQGGGMHVGMPRGVKITHIATDRICICNSERSQHKNRDIALAGIKAMIAAAPKPEKE